MECVVIVQSSIKEYVGHKAAKFLSEIWDCLIRKFNKAESKKVFLGIKILHIIIIIS